MESKYLTIIAKIVATQDKQELVKEEFLKIIDKVRAEEGCIRYDFHQDNENANLFLVYETWENRDLWQVHMENVALKEFVTATEGAIDSLDVNEMTQVG